MKLIEQYLHVIGNHLPLRGKKDIIAELRSLLLDELEAKYGPHPQEKDILAAIGQFGSPKEVARRYTGDRPLIARPLEDAYFFILKIMAFGITIGFTVSLIVGLIGNAFTEISPLKTILDFFLKTGGAIISGTGSLTLIFIGLSRFPCIPAKELDFEEWKPEDLKGVELDNSIPSKIESLLSVIAILALIIVANIAPSIVSQGERSIQYTGLVLKHTVDIGRLIPYIRIATVLWIIEAFQCAYLYFRQNKPLAFVVSELVLKIASPVLSLVMFADSLLYNNYEGIVGIRALFLIGAIGGAVSLIKFIISEARKRLENRAT